MECVKLIKQKVEPKPELNARQRKAILHLLSAKTIKQAAKDAKIRLPTLYKWMKEPLFRDELERLRSEIVSDTVATLKVYSLQAVGVLADLMNNSETETIKRGCAGDILENTRSFIQIKDMEQRLEALENAIINSSNERGGGIHVYQQKHA